MTRLTPSEFVNALKEEGVQVVIVSREGKTWPNNTTAGTFNPSGIMNHHTAMDPNKVKPAFQVSLLWEGRPGLNGPLSHIGLGPKGTAFLTGWDNCNHAGKGDKRVLNAIRYERSLPSPQVDDTDGNPWFWGIEVMHAGTHPKYPDAQIEALVKINAAICRASSKKQKTPWTHKSTLHHKQWSRRKIDMSYGGELRTLIRECLAMSPGKWSLNGPVADPVAKEPVVVFQPLNERHARIVRNLDKWIARLRRNNRDKLADRLKEIRKQLKNL